MAGMSFKLELDEMVAHEKDLLLTNWPERAKDLVKQVEIDEGRTRQEWIKHGQSNNSSVSEEDMKITSELMGERIQRVSDSA